MKVLVLCEYPPLPGGLATQGELFCRGLREIGVDVHAVHLESDCEKAWYYRWFAPDVAVGIGYWGYTPDIILHPQRHGVLAVPWLVADGYIADHRDVLNDLPLILLTSHWVKEVYIRDGIRPDHLEVLPVGCDSDVFIPRERSDPRVQGIREMLGVAPDEVMILTVGGDAASKGGQEVMRALATLEGKVPRWKYVCKVWPQERTVKQTNEDLALAQQLGIADRVVFASGCCSRNFMPYLLAACDIYAGPSRLEGFGMPQVEAGACGKPVIAVNAMAFRDTLVHGKTAFLAGVAQANYRTETTIPDPAGGPGRRVVFDPPRIADYRAEVDDIARALLALLTDSHLRQTMGAAAREHVTAKFDYRVTAQRFVDLVEGRILTPSATTSPMAQRLAVTA